jgi:hypothetical protein
LLHEYGWLSFLADVALAHAWLVVTSGALLLGAALVAASRDAAGGGDVTPDDAGL